ncbi:hypothetical protein Desti_0270 [Desulfomonile tiedjei DSM 6799]|uniref:Uncharacterized protein n=1 Tax=Desulfomonile tiedjei (strain ATCC 49306 / DSM 6799 / DCB-1) TaxID=706587 RepID=I4C0C1_DESTA|nr:hypothetical protein Desti_0270 [Desulfomonile tiedjei DSM 6799]
MPAMRRISSAGVPAGENLLICLVNCSPARRPALPIAGNCSSQSVITFENRYRRGHATRTMVGIRKKSAHDQSEYYDRLNVVASCHFAFDRRFLGDLLCRESLPKPRPRSFYHSPEPEFPTRKLGSGECQKFLKWGSGRNFLQEVPPRFELASGVRDLEKRGLHDFRDSIDVLEIYCGNGKQKPNP